MRHFLLAFILLSFASPGLADCQDTCTAGEAVCTERCTSTGSGPAKTLSCVTKCTKTANNCAKRCPSKSKQEFGSSERSFSSTFEFKGAFPLNTETKNFSTSACCKAGAIKGPMCALVLCTGEQSSLTEGRNWSGVLFDSESNTSPKNLCSTCISNPTRICGLIKCQAIDEPLIGLSPSNKEKFRQHLEAVRIATDYGRITGQISQADQKMLLDAYRKDFRSVFNPNR